MADSILGMSNDEIIAAAQEMGMTDSSTRVVGVYYEGSIDVVSAGFFGAGGEYVRFVGVDLETGERVVTSYGGLSAGGGVSLIPNTNVGGGAFGFTGDPSALGGWSAGGQLSAGVTAGVSINLDGSGILFFAGADTSIGFNGAAGYTYRVAVDDQVIFNFGIAEHYDYTFSGDQHAAAMHSLVNSPRGEVEIEYLHPGGYIITQRFQRIDNGPESYRVNVFESITDLDGNAVPSDIASQHISNRVWQFELSSNDVRDIQSFEECFSPEVPIDMWPLDPDLKPGPEGIYDQDEVRAKAWKKPIELIEVDDVVVSFDDDGNLVPGPVTRTFQNNAKILLDFHGTRVTPGHVYHRADSKKSYKYETLIDVLRDDGVIKHQDGTLIRAATNVPVGDGRDGFVKAVTGARRADGTIEPKDHGRIRLGTRFLVGEGKARKSFAVADLIRAGGGVVGADEMIRVGDGPPMPFHWDFGDTLPKPEDFVLACSGTTLEDIYKAAEWESQGPRLPAPMVLDGGPVQPLSDTALSAMPRNEPLEVAHESRTDEELQ